MEELARTAGHGLGIVPTAAFGTATVTLAAGDALLLFTDGVTEAMDASERMFGDERLEEVLRDDRPAGGAQPLHGGRARRPSTSSRPAPSSTTT